MRGGIAATAGTTGYHEFGHSGVELAAERQKLSLDQRHIERDSQPPATFDKTLQMTFEQLRLTAHDFDSLEQAVAIGQAAIIDGQPGSRLSVDPAGFHSANRRNTSEPLVPPKPNELEIATSMGIGFA